eukprot:5802511-Pyramimonas_sp.AAC.1
MFCEPETDGGSTPGAPPCAVEDVPLLPQFASPKRVAGPPPEHPLWREEMARLPRFANPERTTGPPCAHPLVVSR